MIRKPIIIGIASYYLTAKEKKLIHDEKPWGIILFRRNIRSFKQLKNLTKNIRKCLNDKKYPILIDEEGGKVSRLSNLINSREFSQSFFGNLYEKDKRKGEMIYKYYLNSICNVLKKVGINVNTIPVMDLLQNFTNNIIKDRSYSSNISTIKKLGALCIKNLKNNKIGSVSKHIPGHGCSKIDSHKNLPIVNFSKKKLYLNDFSAFVNVNSNFVMTAHIIYKKIDPNNVATQSDIIIRKIIRKKLKFKGIIISDDISMKALKGDIIKNAKKALGSGCNLILHCNGKIAESSKLLKNLDKIDNFTKKKTQQFYRFLI